MLIQGVSARVTNLLSDALAAALTDSLSLSLTSTLAESLSKTGKNSCTTYIVTKMENVQFNLFCSS